MVIENAGLVVENHGLVGYKSILSSGPPGIHLTLWPECAGTGVPL